MAESTVEIEYIVQALAQAFGCGVRPTPIGLARDHVKRGWARFIDPKLNISPVPTEEEIRISVGLRQAKEKKVGLIKEDLIEPPKKIPYKNWTFPHSPEVPYMKEEVTLTPVAYIATNFDNEFLIHGVREGFQITLVTPSRFSIGSLLYHDLIVVDSDLSSFSEEQKRRLKWTLYQKRIPYIYYVTDIPNVEEKEWTRQAMIGAEYRIYLDKNIASMYLEEFGEMAYGNTLDSSNMANHFWKMIYEALKRKRG